MTHPPFNPLSRWMANDDLYITFDSMEVEKKHRAADTPTQVAHFENGRMTLPMFLWISNGLMQQSALEAHYDKPLDTPKDLRSFADFLQRNDEHSFVIKIKNFRLQRKGMEQINEAAEAVAHSWQAMLEINPFFRGMLKGLGSNPFTHPEIDLGTLARECAKWTEALDRLPSTGRGR